MEKGCDPWEGPPRRREAGWHLHVERAGDRAGSDSSLKKKEQIKELRTRQGDKRKEACVQRAEESGAESVRT